MKVRFAVAVLALPISLVLSPTLAQWNGCPPGFCSPRTSTPAAYVGPGDIVSGAYAWYGLRAYNAAYAASTGNIADLVAVTGGAAVCTLKAAADGTADIAGTYCGGSTAPVACAAASGGSCKIAKLYDQTGNSRDASQGTLATMPSMVFGPVAGLASNRPAMTCNGSQNLLSTATYGILAQPMTWSAVAIRTSGTSDSGVVAGSAGNQPEIMLRGANVANIFAGSFPTSQSQADNAWHSLHGVFNSSSSFINVDGASAAPGNAGSGNFPITGQAAYICRDGFSQSLTGRVNEAGLWASALTGTNITNLYNNQKAYWGY